MIFIGMIFQYNSEQGTGLIMLSDGGQKEFSQTQWADSINSPAVGQKIAYETDVTSVKVRVASQDDISRASAKPKEESSSDNKNETSVDEYLKHFTDLGFKLVKDTNSDAVRTLILRSFATGESQELIITQTASSTTVVEKINGKIVPLSNNI